MGEALRYTPEEYSDARPTLRLVRPEELLDDSLQDESGHILAVDVPLRKGESIYNTYDPSNDVTFLRRHSDLSEARLFYYLEGNLIKFVDEFALEASHQKIPGVIDRDGRFELVGFDVTAMCAETAALEGAGPRERAEYTGMQRVGQLLQEGLQHSENPENVRVVWISPPKGEDTNYGIGFRFKVGRFSEELQGYPVTEEILRYDEKFGSLRKSKEIYTELQSRAGQPWTAHHFESSIDFLNEPILMYGDDIDDYEILEDVFDITSEDIDFTQEFEKRVRMELQPLIHAYTSLALAMADGRIQHTEARNKDLKETLGRIFYWSKKVGERMKAQGPISAEERYVDIHAHTADGQYREARDRGELLLQNGTSCPVVKESIYSFAEKQTTLCCTCPLCGKKVEARISNGKITCNKCGGVGKWDPKKAKRQDDNEDPMRQSSLQPKMGQIIDFVSPREAFGESGTPFA